jgi:hypothetical protein|tara:strand:+ start:80 stop:664 length:585 start_codon:yes stop_codon:yes gene_type:complete
MGDNGESPAMRQGRFVVAAAENNLTMLTILLFPTAPRKGEDEAQCKTRLLLSGGACDPVDVNGYDTYGYTALISAVSAGSMGAVDWLMNNGADVNQRDSHGFAPIHEACFNQRKDVLSYLMQPQWEMDVRLPTFEGDTPLDIVVQMQYAEMINFFSRPYFHTERGYLYKGDEPEGALGADGEVIDKDKDDEELY